MNSSFKFLQKLWFLNQKIFEEIKLNHSISIENELEKITNQFVKKVEINIENFSYNKIIANFHEIHSQLNKIINTKIDKKTWIKNYYKILIAMSPVIPHFCSECLENLDKFKSNEVSIWPEIDSNVLVEDKINFVIQINGKKRGILKLNKDIQKHQIMEEINKESKIKNYIENKSIKNTIFVPNKLINIIINN